MARPRPPVPRYSHHKATDRAFVQVDGRFVYLGRYGSPESHEKYARLVRECQTASPAVAVAAIAGDPGGVASPLTVAAVLAAFWNHAKATYAYDPTYDGRRPPGEIGCFFDAMRPVLALYANTPAADFGPKALTLVRQEMIARGWCRNVINRHVVRVRTIVKWAVAAELIPGEVHHRLTAVAGLRRGHKGVRETAKVQPVPADVLAATLAVCSPRLKAMIELQLLTGMRSGNLCQIRTADIDTSGGDDGTAAWVYRPRQHKTAHHGHELAIRIGPRAQAVLAPYLRPADRERYVFSPADEMAEVRAARAAARTTPASCGNTRGTNVKRSPKKVPGPCYTPDSYGSAIARACDRADLAARRRAAEAEGVDPATVAEAVPADERLVPQWNAHRLRHNRGTVVRAKHGTDGVLAALGQRTAAMADRYAEIEAEKAERIAAELG